MKLSPAATGAAEFRAQARPSTVLHAPSPTSRRKSKGSILGNPPGRSDERGCIGRLRSRLSAKLLRIPPPKAGYSHFCSIENAAASVAGPASGIRGGRHLTHSSQGMLVGKEIATDKYSSDRLENVAYVLGCGRSRHWVFKSDLGFATVDSDLLPHPLEALVSPQMPACARR